MTARVDDQHHVSAQLVREGRTARIVVAGEVDLAAGPVLGAAAGRLHPAHDHVVIDLRGVTFLDVVGFDALLDLRDLLVGAGCRTEFDTTGMAGLLLAVMDRAQLERSPFHPAG